MSDRQLAACRSLTSYNAKVMSAERPTRRKFLQGRADARELTDSAGDVNREAAETIVDTCRPATEPALAVDRGTLLVSVRRRAMACEWEVQLAASRDDDSMEHVFAALDLVESLEDQLTVYRVESEVQQINRTASARPVSVEPRLFGVLKMAERIHHDTAGAHDITSGPLSETWGFSRRRGRIPDPAEIAAAILRVGMDAVVLDEATQTISFRRPGTTINLNSIGKGYAIDRMAELLGEHGVSDYLLHGGKSSVLARGDHPGRSAGSGWTIGLRHPLRPAERLAEFFLHNESLATSGSGTQYFRRGGRLYGHILDPRTGRPAEGVYSTTVIAPTAAEADALSTAFYVMGPERTAEYCTSHPEVAAVLVCPGAREASVRLHAFGLDDRHWQQLADH
jgi:thiamine biosynthesis lipoprotein